METPQLIRLGGDHAGYALKNELIAHLSELGYATKDFGPFNDDSVDYPDFIHPLVQDMKADAEALSIIICGSANGVAITANKYEHIRAAIAWQPELAALGRQHNNANVLALPARFIDLATAKQIVDTYLTAAFEGGRHQRRVDKITSGCA